MRRKPRVTRATATSGATSNPASKVWRKRSTSWRPSQVKISGTPLPHPYELAYRRLVFPRPLHRISHRGLKPSPSVLINMNVIRPYALLTPFFLALCWLGVMPYPVAQLHERAVGSVPDVDIGGFNVLRIRGITNHRIQI